jgi:succinoglycan biosynthesis protein ExoM
VLFGRSLAQAVAAILLAAVLLPFGLHRSAHWLMKASANLGKLSAYWGWHYHEYA